MKAKLAWSLGAALVLLVLVWALAGNGETGPRLVPVTVERGDIADRLVCRGEFAQRNGRQIRVPFSGRLQYVVDDGGWVDQGEEIFAISEDDAVREAAEARSQLLAARQDLRLAELKRRSTREQEERSVGKAERALEIERLRLRIETSKPEGGDALIRLDRELMPMEERSSQAREAAERSQLAWQQAQDAYLEAVDARITVRDRLLRQDARSDELRAEAERSVDGLQTHEIEARTQAAKELAEIDAERKALREQLPLLAEAVRAARAARDALVAAKEADAEKLAEAEATEAELRIRIEIEKRNLPALQLAIDLDGARLAATQAQEETRRAEVAYAAGALAQSKLDEAKEKAARTTGQVAILESRYAIASRGVTDERLAELQARIERAEARALAVRADRDRALAIADQEMLLNQARVERLTHDVERRSSAFPEVLESTIAFLDQEIAALDSEDGDDAKRMVEAQAERSALAERLDEARKHPANVVRAEVAGVVRVQRQDGRPKQAGDQVWEQDILVEIFPPGTMTVSVRVNEVDIAKLEVGMAAEVQAPALPEYRSPGKVIRLSALGRDKLEGTGRVAGVVLFDGEIAVDTVVEGMRQGMTALVTIDVGRRQEVLYLPLEAVRKEGDTWMVTLGSTGSPQSHAIVGEPFGDRYFVVESGLTQGDTVLVEQP